MTDFQKISERLGTLPFVDTAPLIYSATGSNAELIADGVRAVGGDIVCTSDIEDLPHLLPQVDCLVLSLDAGSSAHELLAKSAELAWVQQKPWLLDLSGCSYSEKRQALAKRLCQFQPTVIKGNLSEIRAWLQVPPFGLGIGDCQEDASLVLLAEVVAKSRQLLKKGQVVAATGRLDVVIDDTEAWLIDNGTPALTKIAGSGDLLSGIMAVAIARQPSLLGALTGAGYFGCCAESAWQTTEGGSDRPFGSFKSCLIDRLADNQTWKKTLRSSAIYEG